MGGISQPLFLWKISVNWQLLRKPTLGFVDGVASQHDYHIWRSDRVCDTPPNTVSFVQRTMINYRIYSILEYWYAMFRRAKKRELITLWAIWIKIHCSFPKHRAASHQCLQPIIHKKTLVSIYFAHMK